MKYFFIITISLISLLAHASENIIKVGVYELPPHLLSENNKPVGPVMDYIDKQVRPALKYRSLNIISMPFARMVEDLKNGNIDVGFLISKTPERALLYDYPETELFQTSSVLIFNPENQIPKLTNPLQINKMLIGHTQGSVVVKFIEQSKARIDFLAGEDTLARNLKKLEMKRLDAVYAPTASHAQYVIKANNFSNKFVVKIIPNTELSLYFAFRKNLPIEIKNIFTSNSNIKKDYLKYLSNYLPKTK